MKQEQELREQIELILGSSACLIGRGDKEAEHIWLEVKTNRLLQLIKAETDKARCDELKLMDSELGIISLAGQGTLTEAKKHIAHRIKSLQSTNKEE